MDGQASWKNFIVKVFATTDAENEKGFAGTGYPISKNKILTALHVVAPKGEEIVRVEVQWPKLPGGDPCCWYSAKVVWPLDADTMILDAAVLEVEFPAGVEWRYLSSEKPMANIAFDSEAYAIAGKQRNGEWHPAKIIGKTHAAADGDDLFTLSVENAPELEDGWRGASGGPVMVRDKLTGILAECPKGYRQKQLDAVPAWKLSAIDSFVQAAGYVEYGIEARALGDMVKGLVEKLSEGAKEKIVAAMLDTKLISETDSSDTVSIAKHLCGVDFYELLKLLNKVHVDLCLSELFLDAEVLCRICQHAAPLIVDQGVVSQLKHALHGRMFLVWGLPIKTRSMLELAMAAVDGRAANHRIPVLPNEHPAGIAQIDLPPDFGADYNQACRDLNIHLWSNYGDPGANQTGQVISDADLEDIQNEINYLIENEGVERPYLCLDNEGSGQLQADMRTYIEHICSKVPDLAVVELGGCKEQAPAERAVTRYLSKMLWRIHSGNLDKEGEGAE